jgi:hypothetical protein
MFFVIANCIIEKGSISTKMKKINIELTEDEAKVIADYIFRKACRLEESNLTDSYCYPRLYSAYHKINKAMKEN